MSQVNFNLWAMKLYLLMGKNNKNIGKRFIFFLYFYSMKSCCNLLNGF
jgi:hypothetical protein